MTEAPEAGDVRWERTVRAETAEQTRELAERLGAQLRAGDLVLLDGELGAGKTTFTQGLGRGLGTVEGIISPTFVLARRHPNDPSGPRPGGPGLVHVDAYRLAGAAQVEDIDLEETLPDWVTVIEWGRGKVEHLSPSRLEIGIERPQGGDRSLADVLAEFGAGDDGVDGEDALGAGAAEEAGELPPSAETEARARPAEDRLEEPGDAPRTLRLRGIGPRWAEPPAAVASAPTRDDAAPR